MPLDAGQRLGPYEILSPIGAGGMGEVYRARDTRLQRQVAIKIVPAAVAGDPEALARFEREAQAVAALTHPNILAIHDFGQANGVTYAVMELLDGRSLAEVLAGGGTLPVRKAIEYAKQIAEGLAAAHEKGIVHRDLKPGNIFVNTDGRVTILDFGLARVNTPSVSENSATVAPGTSPGMVMGTAGYMSPEQVRAANVDYRSDIFAFGAVLYEMVSGRRAFQGATPADTMSAVLNADPADFDGGAIPPALDRIVRRCLEKEPNRRFQSTRDLGFALDSLSTRSDSGASATIAPPSRSRLPMIGALCVIAGAAIGALAMSMRPAPPTAVSPVVRFQIPSAVGIPAMVAISPGGDALAWGASVAEESAGSIFVRPFNQTSATKVPESIGFDGFSWRSNGRQLLIGKEGQIMTVDTQSGLQTPVLDGRSVPGLENFRGVAVGENDQLLIGGTRAIFLATLGTSEKPREVAHPEGDAFQWFGFPQWFPGGRMLYMAKPPGNAPLQTFVRPISGGDAQRLDLPTDITRVLADANGNLVFARNGVLLAQHFDPSTLKPTGEPVTLGTDVISTAGGALAADLSASGALAYRSGTVALSRFEWFNRTGASLAKMGPEGNFTNFDLTADGTRIAALRREAGGPYATSVWLIDGTRDTSSQLATATNPQDSISDPTWSPDGQRLAYRRGNTVVVRNTFGGEERTVVTARGYPDSWSRDGRYIAVGKANGTLFDLFAERVDGTTEEIRLTQGVVADEPRFSPDGKWVAYHAAIANTTHVYVVPFPPTGEKFQMSTTSGVQPRWRGDGTELFFLDLDGNVNSVEMPRSNPRDARPPKVLFHSDLKVSPINDQLAVAADGSRFLLRRTASGSTEMPVNIILNWRELLK